MIDAHHGWNKSIKPLLVGYVVSWILTLLAYFITKEGYLSGKVFSFTVLGLACLQALFQFIYFFHLGVESKPRWNLMIFLFMLLVLVILVGGSLWIMYHLDYNMMIDMKPFP